MPTASGLRGWQAEALARYRGQDPRDFLVVATPGAGKTSFALTIARDLVDRRIVRKVVVVCPTEHLKHQWARAAQQFDIRLDHTYGSGQTAGSVDFDGVAVTYAGVAARPWAFRVAVERTPTLVIIDEIHHAGDSRSWGDALTEAFEPAGRRLALTGTPFRSDANPIPFVEYVPDGDGRRSRADFDYGYASALQDGVVRPVVFYAYSGTMRWRTRAGHELRAALTDRLTKDARAHAWRTALDPEGDWIRHVLRAADRRLTQIRRQTPDAGGLVIAGDQVSARAYARLLRSITGRSVPVAVSDDSGADDVIETFSAGGDPWLVAVRMVSEGVDIPRLTVGVYATPASTPLYFAQAIGRFVRRRRADDSSAAVFLPSVPVLLAHAAAMEEQRDHVLNHRTPDEWDEPSPAAERLADQSPAFMPIDSQATLDHLLVDGDMIEAVSEEDFLIAPPVAPPRPPGRVQTALPSTQMRTIRSELNNCVRAYAQQTNSTPALVHGRLRDATRGPQIAHASVADLQMRLDLVRRWAVGRR